MQGRGTQTFIEQSKGTLKSWKSKKMITELCDRFQCKYQGVVVVLRFHNFGVQKIGILCVPVFERGVEMIETCRDNVRLEI